MKVFAVIVTYNGMKWIEKCINSILNSTYLINTIIVDNGSTDGTIEFIKNGPLSNNLILQKNNLGFGAANNIGIRHALKMNADFIILFNQDVYFENNLVQDLVTEMTNQKSFAILSPIHINANHKIDSLFLSYIKSNKEIMGDYLTQKNKNIYSVSFVNAAFWCIDAKWIKKIGGFNPIFFMYGEDNNICNRLRYFGGQIGVCTKLYITHDRENRVLTNVHKKLIFKTRLRNKLFDINNSSPLLSGIKFIFLNFISTKSISFLISGIKQIIFYLKNKKYRKLQYEESAFL